MCARVVESYYAVRADADEPPRSRLEDRCAERPTGVARDVLAGEEDGQPNPGVIIGVRTVEVDDLSYPVGIRYPDL